MAQEEGFRGKIDIRFGLTRVTIIVPEEPITIGRGRNTARENLVRTLSRLAPSDLAMLLSLIEGAASHVSQQGTVPEKVAELIRWAESSNGPGLNAIRKALRRLR